MGIGQRLGRRPDKNLADRCASLLAHRIIIEQQVEPAAVDVLWRAGEDRLCLFVAVTNSLVLPDNHDSVAGQPVLNGRFDGTVDHSLPTTSSVLLHIVRTQKGLTGTYRQKWSFLQKDRAARKLSIASQALRGGVMPLAFQRVPGVRQVPGGWRGGISRSGLPALRISLIFNCELGCRREGLCLVAGYRPAGRPSLAGRRSADANIGDVAGLQFQ